MDIQTYLVVKEYISSDGTTLTIGGGNITLDSAESLGLDGDTQILFKDWIRN